VRISSEVKALLDPSKSMFEGRKLWSLSLSGGLAADLPDGSPSRDAVLRAEPKADASDWSIKSG
jgi:hypothetical protein